MIRYWLYKVGQFIVNSVPRRWGYAFAIFLSDIHYCLSTRDRRSVENNLKIILNTEGDVSKETREVFRNFGRYLVDFFRMAKQLDQSFIDKNITVRNLERLNQVLDRGRGGILVSAHMGNWELGGVLMPMLGYPLTAVALPHKHQKVNDLFNAQRQAWGITVVPVSMAVRRCLETLKNNKLVALVGDRDFTAHGEEMDFLGRRALIPKGPAVFSIKTGAPIVPCFFLRNSDDTFTLTIEEPIYPQEINPNTIDQETLHNLIRKYIAVVEAKIRAYPTQWLMFREFWIK